MATATKKADKPVILPHAKPAVKLVPVDVLEQVDKAVFARRDKLGSSHPYAADWLAELLRNPVTRKLFRED